jgi:hypothetical protein
MSKKKVKIKKRRNLNTDILFHKRETKQLLLMEYSLRQALPNSEERNEYIKNLIRGLETAPYVEHYENTKTTKK